MNRFTFVLLCLALMASCSGSLQEEMPKENVPVRWNFLSVDGYSTKSLVEELEYLEWACTPTTKEYMDHYGHGQSIGVWADYSVTIDGETIDASDVFKGTRLIYNPESSLMDTKWEYDGDPAYWVAGGKYVFRAFYPQSEVNVMSKLSNAKTLVVEMNTATVQRDMLLAHNSYDTNTGMDAAGNLKTMNDPVAFKFRHAMSALKFKFKFYDGSDGVLYSEDALTSCWLETTKDEAFSLTGIMIYGNGEDDKEGPIQWRNQYRPAEGIHFYHWIYSSGVEFSNKRGSGTWNPENDQIVATAYTSGTGTVDHGAEYAKNGGWVMIVPQESTGDLRLCFTTKAGGDAVFSVGIPAVTGTSRDKYEDDPDDVSSHNDPDGTDFIPGWRYTYTISISKTDAAVDLSIAPWRRLDSSFDIKF